LNHGKPGRKENMTITRRTTAPVQKKTLILYGGAQTLKTGAARPKEVCTNGWWSFRLEREENQTTKTEGGKVLDRLPEENPASFKTHGKQINSEGKAIKDFPDGRAPLKTGKTRSG